MNFFIDDFERTINVSGSASSAKWFTLNNGEHVKNVVSIYFVSLIIKWIIMKYK